MYEKLNLTVKEPINAFTHLIGVLLSIAGLATLLLKAIKLSNPYYIVGAIIYGSSLILLYAASTIYHWIK